MKKRRVVLGVALALMVGGGVFLVRSVREPANMEQQGSTKKTTYQCSMHPTIVSDKPDICPICQMKLQPVEEAPSAAPALQSEGAPKEGKVLFYRHPMRPDVTSPKPARDEMGMDYIPVYEEEASHSEGASNVPGHAPFTLATERQQLIGVTTAKVERKNLDIEIRTVGKVAYDPELYRAIAEYREAIAGKHQVEKSPWPEAHSGADGIVRAAALRLRQLGVSEQQLRQIVKDESEPLNLLLPGDSVWIYAQVYEYEVDLVKPGQMIVVTVPSSPGRTYTANIVAIDPILNPMTRTVRVRALVRTLDGGLRPETFVHVKISVALGATLAVPEGAVLDTGEHQIVFVAKGEGRFEPRSVKIGREAQDHYEVLAGLEAGEEVVTSANFLIDSESRFRAALAAFSSKATAPHPH